MVFPNICRALPCRGFYDQSRVRGTDAFLASVSGLDYREAVCARRGVHLPHWDGAKRCADTTVYQHTVLMSLIYHF